MSNPPPPKPYGAPVKPVTGAPTEYSDEFADRICALVGDGSNLTKLSKLDENPPRSTMIDWMDKHKYFTVRYMRACEARAEGRVDKMDEITQELKDGIVDHQYVRIAHDAIKWQAGKEKSSRFGDASLLKLADANGELIETTTVFVNAEEAAKAYAKAVKGET